MLTLVYLTFFLLLTSGCAAIDPEVSSFRAMATEPRSLQGTYRNFASYYSNVFSTQTASGMYAEAPKCLGEYFKLYAGLAECAPDSSNWQDVSIKTPTPERLRKNVEETKVIITVDEKSVTGRLILPDEKKLEKTYFLESDYHFRDGYLVFSGGLQAHGSPLLGFINNNDERWTVDKDGNLVIIRDTSVAGIIGIFPVVVISSTMSLFPRVQEAPSSLSNDASRVE